jgi:hypothetical protein
LSALEKNEYTKLPSATLQAMRQRAVSTFSLVCPSDLDLSVF